MQEMNGCFMPAVTNSGSGNQGMTCSFASHRICQRT
ncbi:MAG: hypothetical protein ACLVEX_10700 [Ruthenibacterium lactatiformans]